MAVRIRLKRMGAKKRPFYRIIVADARAPRDGRFIETLGTYNPLTEPSEVKLAGRQSPPVAGAGSAALRPCARYLETSGVVGFGKRRCGV